MREEKLARFECYDQDSGDVPHEFGCVLYDPA